MPTTKVVVNFEDGTSYNVRIGTGLLDTLGQQIASIPSLAKTKRVALITDSNVGPLYAAKAKGSLVEAGYTVFTITLPAGETTKSPEVLAELWQAFATKNMVRHDAVVALGGGVVGDIAGLASATYMRGIPFVQVPTTLLAAVDASVGGKTAVNLPQGKNLVGAFHQPVYVACDVLSLATLPQREWTSGLAEVVKTALITDDESLFWLDSQADGLKTPEAVNQNAATVVEMIARAVVAKADVVGQDPFETKGVREVLNYGHTFGHALECVLGLGELSHGRAVAQGMRVAAELSVQCCSLDEGILAAQNELLDKLGLPADDLSQFTPEDFLAYMRLDKKNVAGSIRLVLLEDVGKVSVQALPEEAIAQAITKVFG